MKGSNKLELNEATMIEAIQFWLDSQFISGKSPKVIAIKADSTTGYTRTFLVETDERPETVPGVWTESVPVKQ